MIKVKATKDGIYAGYYRTVDEVFEIDEKPFEVKDEFGRPVPEMDENGKPVHAMKNGKPVIDANGKSVFKTRMATWFTTEWMERVGEEADITNDYPPFQMPSVYREKKTKPGHAAPRADTQPVFSSESPI